MNITFFSIIIKCKYISGVSLLYYYNVLKPRLESGSNVTSAIVGPAVVFRTGSFVQARLSAEIRPARPKDTGGSLWCATIRDSPFFILCRTDPWSSEYWDTFCASLLMQVDRWPEHPRFVLPSRLLNFLCQNSIRDLLNWLFQWTWPCSKCHLSGQSLIFDGHKFK